jgi:hypothetical protein
MNSNRGHCSPRLTHRCSFSPIGMAMPPVRHVEATPTRARRSREGASLMLLVPDEPHCSMLPTPFKKCRALPSPSFSSPTRHSSPRAHPKAFSPYSSPPVRAQRPTTLSSHRNHTVKPPSPLPMRASPRAVLLQSPVCYAYPHPTRAVGPPGGHLRSSIFSATNQTPLHHRSSPPRRRCAPLVSP